jgi:hypothetical protein
MKELLELLQSAEALGWSSTSTVSLDKLVQQVRLSRYQIVRDREAGPEISVLEPQSVAEAQEQSLSATYGEGPQPLHTDGAHQTDPPDYVLLTARSISNVPTFLLPFRKIRDGVDGELFHDLRNGLFTVRTGRTCFLASAFHSGRLRFDPGCMEPADGRARRVASFFAAHQNASEPFTWCTPDAVLAINNRNVLHARGDASGETERVLRRVTLRVKGRLALPKSPSPFGAS